MIETLKTALLGTLLVVGYVSIVAGMIVFIIYMEEKLISITDNEFIINVILIFMIILFIFISLTAISLLFSLKC